MNVNEKTGPNGAATPQPGPASDPNHLEAKGITLMMARTTDSVSVSPKIVMYAEPVQIQITPSLTATVGVGDNETGADTVELTIGTMRLCLTPTMAAALGASLVNAAAVKDVA